MNILLINLTRFGDLLQSQAAITDLIRQGCKIAVLCLENFTEAAKRLSGVSMVFSLPGSAFLAALHGGSVSCDTRANAKQWPIALARLAVLRENLETHFAPDALCNLTPSLAARMLARFLAGNKSCTGFIVDEYGFNASGNLWSTFLQGASLRGVSPFNIVDIFRKIVQIDTLSHCPGKKGESSLPSPLPGDAGLQTPSEDSLTAMRERLRAEAPINCKGYVALQLGASENRRRWPVAYFAELGDRLWNEEGLCPILVGSKAEKILADRYVEMAQRPFINVCGESSLEELAAILCACGMLVTNDTGTMHYAAGLGVPILAIFLATAQPFDTGPYREGCCSLEPALSCHPCAFGTVCSHKPLAPPKSGDIVEDRKEYDEPCRFMITAEHAAELALYRLRHGKWRQMAAPDKTLPFRIWLSEYDNAGFMHQRSLSGHENETRTLWFLLQRHYIRQYLDRDPEAEFMPRAISESVAFHAAAEEKLMADIDNAVNLLELMRQQGRVLTVQPLSLMRKRFLSTCQKIGDVFTNSPYLKALSLLWIQATQAQGDSLAAVLTASEDFRKLIVAIRHAVRDEQSLKTII
jgi:ADP-heptose:LPS heptosyltransferase